MTPKEIAERWLIECREETEFYILAKAYLAQCKVVEAAKEIQAIAGKLRELNKLDSGLSARAIFKHLQDHYDAHGSLAIALKELES